MKKRRKRFSIYRFNKKYIIDRQSINIIELSQKQNEKVIIDLEDVEFISRAASHELLKLKEKYCIHIINHRHLIVYNRKTVLSGEKRNNFVHMISNDKRQFFNESLKKIDIY